MVIFGEIKYRTHSPCILSQTVGLKHLKIQVCQSLFWFSLFISSNNKESIWEIWENFSLWLFKISTSMQDENLRSLVFILYLAVNSMDIAEE